MIGKLFWIALTLVFTFCFVVLFEYGMTNYVENAKTEFQDLKALVIDPPKKPGDHSDKVVP